jgi:GTPase SAR1 family protein
MYLRDTNAALIVYDVNDAESLNSAEKWLLELKDTAPSELMIALAGSKRDLPGPHAISLQDGQNFAKKHQIPIFFEVSAKNRENID